MMQDNWELQIHKRVDSWVVEFWIFRRRDDMQIEVLYEHGTKTFKMGENAEPTLRLPNDGVFQAIVDAIHRDFKPSQGKFTEGKLEATERHLFDLRQLLKLK